MRLRLDNWSYSLTVAGNWAPVRRTDPHRLFSNLLSFGYDPLMDKWVRIDRRYNNPYRLTRYAKRVITTWVVVVIVVITLMDTTHGWFAIPTGVALAGYAGYRVRSRRRGLLAGRPAAWPAAQFNTPALRFNPPPEWPAPQLGWTPPAGWQPDPSWPQAAPACSGWSAGVRIRKSSGIVSGRRATSAGSGLSSAYRAGCLATLWVSTAGPACVVNGVVGGGSGGLRDAGWWTAAPWPCKRWQRPSP